MPSSRKWKYRPSNPKSKRARRRLASECVPSSRPQPEKASRRTALSHTLQQQTALRPANRQQHRGRSGSLPSEQPRFSSRSSSLPVSIRGGDVGIIRDPQRRPSMAAASSTRPPRSPLLSPQEDKTSSLPPSTSTSSLSSISTLSQEFLSPPQGPSSTAVRPTVSLAAASLPVRRLPLPAVKSPALRTVSPATRAARSTVIVEAAADKLAAAIASACDSAKAEKSIDSFSLGPSISELTKHQDDDAMDQTTSPRASSCPAHPLRGDGWDDEIRNRGEVKNTVFKNEILVAHRFDELLAFAHNDKAQTPCFVGLDIDETLVQTRHMPCVLLTSAGVQAFQQLVNKRYGNDFKAKNQLCRALETHLKEKVLVEPSIPAVVKALQDSGCFVFGITARFSELASNTDDILARVGIDLTRTSPFPARLEDSELEAVVQNGVVYCNNQNKGEVLNRFLCSTVFQPMLDAHSLEVISPGVLVSKHTGQPTSVDPVATKLPSAFVFIDDVRTHVDGYAHSLAIARALKIPIRALHYVPQDRALEEGLTKVATPQERTRILLHQIDLFVRESRIVSDKDARFALNFSAPTMSA